jgi:hypothetical protein
MASLKELYEAYGAGVWLTNEPSIHYGLNPFKITGERDAENYNVEYQNGASGYIMKECDETNDYCLLSDVRKDMIYEK